MLEEIEKSKHVSIQTKQITSRNFNIFIDSTINWDDWCLTDIRKVTSIAKQSDVVSLHMNSFGGNVYVMSAIIDALRNTRAATELHLTGCAMSAGLIIFASLLSIAKKVFINEEATVMMHSAFTIALGKPDEIEDYNVNFKKVNKVYLKPLKKILTKKQWNKVYKNEKELWLTGKEFYHLVKKAYPSEEGKESKIHLIKFE